MQSRASETSVDADEYLSRTGLDSHMLELREGSAKCHFGNLVGRTVWLCNPYKVLHPH